MASQDLIQVQVAIEAVCPECLLRIGESRLTTVAHDVTEAANFHDRESQYSKVLRELENHRRTSHHVESPKQEPYFFWRTKDSADNPLGTYHWHISTGEKPDVLEFTRSPQPVRTLCSMELDVTFMWVLIRERIKDRKIICPTCLENLEK